jgi:hypothetical protein
VSKQQALQHVLNALQVLHAREAVVAALSSHSNIAGFASTGKLLFHILFSLCLIKQYTMEMYGRLEAQFYAFVTLVLDRGE